MGVERVREGAERREMKRRMLGRPGSLRRWLAGSVVWFMLCGLAYAWFRHPLIIFAAVIGAVLAFRARSLFVGDEDELNPALNRSVLDALRSGVEPQEQSARMDPADWFSRRPNTFTDAPPPPVAEADAAPGSET